MEMQREGNISAPIGLKVEPPQRIGDRLVLYFLRLVEGASAVFLAIDLVVVVVSVIFRYFLHNPLQWSDEVAQMLLIANTFLGGAAALARGEHLGVAFIRSRLSANWRSFLQAFSGWIIGLVAV